MIANSTLTLVGSVVSIAELLSRVFDTNDEADYSAIFNSINKEGSEFLVANGGGFVEISVSERQEILSMVTNPFRSTIVFIEMLRQIKTKLIFQSGNKRRNFFGIIKDDENKATIDSVELIGKWHDELEGFLYGKN